MLRMCSGHQLTTGLPASAVITAIPQVPQVLQAAGSATIVGQHLGEGDQQQPAQQHQVCQGPSCGCLD